MQLEAQITDDAYLEKERASQTKSEFVNGMVVAMAGASPRHNAVVRNVLFSLTSRLRGKPCQPYASDLRIHVPATGLYAYPDISVVCEPMDLHPKDSATVLNPRVLVEVLSPATEAYDRGAKFGHYRSIPSLQCYAMVVTGEQRFEAYERTGKKWQLEEFVGDEGFVQLRCIDVMFPLTELYIDLPPE